MHIVFLHGAWSSSKSFNFVIQNLGLTTGFSTPSYNTKASFDSNLDYLFEETRSYDEVFFVGHSLGGIYALHLSDIFDKRCVGGVTIATPYGGIESSSFFRFMYPMEPVFKYLSPSSRTVWYNSFAKRPDNWTQIVCKSCGVPWIREDNDGVVTKSSQTWLSNMNYHELDCGHHEVLQDPRTVELIKSKI